MLRISERARPKGFSGIYRVAFIIVGFGICTSPAQEKVSESPATDLAQFRLPSAAPSPEGNTPTADRLELGKMLFFDPRLSGSNRMSCASCHNPSLAWSDGLSTGVGDRMQALRRKTPTIINSGFNSFQMWDGRIRSLEEQAWSPMLDSAEMHGTQAQILVKLNTMPGYLAAFEKAYPGQGITKETVAEAIASFERTVVSRDSPFDRWLEGDDPLSLLPRSEVLHSLRVKRIAPLAIKAATSRTRVFTTSV